MYIQSDRKLLFHLFLSYTILKLFLFPYFYFLQFVSPRAGVIRILFLHKRTSWI